MSKLPVWIDYIMAVNVIKGLRKQLNLTNKWLKKIENILDDAHKNTLSKISNKEDTGTWP